MWGRWDPLVRAAIARLDLEGFPEELGAPSDEEVRALIALDGAALLECLGTLVNGGEGGDGAAGAPALARFLSEL